MCAERDTVVSGAKIGLALLSVAGEGKSANDHGAESSERDCSAGFTRLSLTGDPCASLWTALTCMISAEVGGSRSMELVADVWEVLLYVLIGLA